MSGYQPRDTGKRLPPLPEKILRKEAKVELVETPPVYIYPHREEGYKESEFEDKRDLRDPQEVGNEILAKRNGDSDSASGSDTNRHARASGGS